MKQKLSESTNGEPITVDTHYTEAETSTASFHAAATTLVHRTKSAGETITLFAYNSDSTNDLLVTLLIKDQSRPLMCEVPMAGAPPTLLTAGLYIDAIDTEIRAYANECGKIHIFGSVMTD